MDPKKHFDNLGERETVRKLNDDPSPRESPSDRLFFDVIAVDGLHLGVECERK